MVEICATYRGGLICEATHSLSTAVLRTEAPADNHGTGSMFSPTDLVATALAVCILTVMGVVAQREELDLEGTTATVVKGMAANPPRRIGSLPVLITIRGNPTPKQRKKLEAAAHACPVHKSLHPDIDAPITFAYPDAAP